MPKLLVVKEREQREYLALSRRADCELLYLLEVADMLGRICSDQDKQLEYLELFKMFCQEYQVWQSASEAYADWKHHILRELEDYDLDTQDLVFANAVRDRERGIITTPEEAVSKSFAYREAYPKVVLMCGPSGSGKSSWIKKHLADYHVVSLDDIREELSGDRTNQKIQGQVMQEAKKRFKHHLRSHHSVIWDATNLRADFRTQICDLAYAYQALVTLVVFQQTENLFFNGNSGREFSVPDEVLQRQIETMEWPLVDEVHRYVVIGEGHHILQSKGGLEKRRNPF